MNKCAATAANRTTPSRTTLPGSAIHCRVLLIVCALLATAYTQAKPNDAEHNRYNVLFIAVDDLRPELGCYGADYVKTPNIDKLAQSGVVFKQHFVAVPTCGSSRYAMLTGRSPLNSGVRGSNNGALYTGGAALKQEQRDGAQSMPELFRRSGYHTVLIGKISHTPDGKVFAYNGKGDGREELPGAWDDYATPYGSWQRGWGTFFAYADGKHREDGQGHRDLFQFTAEKDNDLPDGLMAETAIAKLKELKQNGKPFFMGLGFFKPHLPFVAPKQDMDAVEAWNIPEPAFREGIETAYYNGGNGEFYSYTMPCNKTKPLALDDAMQTKRAYLACVRYTDRQVGKVLDALEEEGLADNTIVVLWGDHGWFLGEAAMWAKHTPLETALHSPLIIRAPGVGNAGMKTDALASTIDIYPTLMDLCKPESTTTEHKLDGVSLLPVMTGEKTRVNDYVVSTWNSATTIRFRTNDRVVFKVNNGQYTDIEVYDMGIENGALINQASDDNQDTYRKLLEQLPLNLK